MGLSVKNGDYGFLFGFKWDMQTPIHQSIKQFHILKTTEPLCYRLKIPPTPKPQVMTNEIQTLNNPPSQLNNTLPVEVSHIAQSVSVEKRNEVQGVLNHVFNGVSKMREQLDAITVADENDKTNMKLANTIRLGVRQVRLDAEKIFDSKRAEVQAQMLGYKTEDQLWLKAKQTMQILTKEIEEAARWKEETKVRFELEQKELKVQQRMLEMAKVAPEMPRTEFENMSDDGFAIFFAQIEKLHQEKVEAERRAEEERIARERAEAEERERVRAENERLRAEAEAREKQLAEEKAKAEAERRAIEKKAAEEKAKQEAVLRKEREAREKIEAELKAKAEAEQRAKKEAEEKAAAELKARQDAEKKAKAAPDKVKLNNFADLLNELSLPEVQSEEAKKIVEEVKTVLTKVSFIIRDKVSNL